MVSPRWLVASTLAAETHAGNRSPAPAQPSPGPHAARPSSSSIGAPWGGYETAHESGLPATVVLANVLSRALDDGNGVPSA